MTESSLGARVRFARELRNMSQRELGEEARLHKSHIPLIEGDHRPHLALSSLTKLADALGVTLDWLVHGTGPGPERTRRPHRRSA